MDRDISTNLKIRLFDGQWNNDNLKELLDDFGELFGLESPKVLPEDPCSVVVFASSGFDDSEASPETLAYCLEQDLLDAGYDISAVEVLDCETRSS